MNQLPPKAEKGKSVLKAWRELREWAQSAQLLPGLNVRLARTAAGTIISFAPPPERFSGAFGVSMADSASARVSYGTIEGIEPSIGGKPVTDPAALLRIEEAKFDKSGQSWVGLAIKYDLKTGKLDKKAKDAVVVEQRDAPRYGTEAGKHFHPLAVIKNIKPDGGPETQRLYQIEYFHLRAAWNGRRLFVYPAA